MAFINSRGAAESYQNPLGGGTAVSVALIIDILFATAFAYVEVWLVVLLPRKILRNRKI
jgi:hypothetical protein